MTVASSTDRIPYDCNGTTNGFAVPFYFLEDSDLLVTHQAADGTLTQLFVGTDFSVSGAGDEDGGAIITNTTYPDGDFIIIKRFMDFTQETAFPANTPLPSDSLERCLDKLTMQDQQLWEKLGRALVLPDIASGVSGLLPTPVVGDLLGWVDAGGGSVELGNVGGSGVGAGAIATANLQDGAVTTAKVADAAITTEKLGSDVTAAITAGSSYAQSGTGAASQTLANFAKSFVTPEQFGCVGDGTTDDTANLQAALTRATGGVLRLTPGKAYKITDALLVNSNTTIIGYGAEIRRGSTVGNMLRNNADGTTGGYTANTNITILGGTFNPQVSTYPAQCTSVAFGHCTDITIRDVSFLEAPVWHGLELNACTRAHVDNCVFTGGAAQALLEEQLQIDLMASSDAFPWFGPYDNTPCVDIRVTDCNFSSGGIGIGSHTSVSGVSHQNIWISDCHFSNQYYAGVEMLNWTGVKITDCRFDSGYYGIVSDVTENRSDYAVRGCTFFNVGNTAYASVTNNNAQAIHFGNTATHRVVSIEGCFVGNHNQTYSTHAIAVLQGEDVRILGNVVRDVNGTGIWAVGGSTVIIKGNRARTTNLSAGSFYGIDVGNTAAASDVVVSGNVSNTINIKSVTHGLCTGNTVTTASGITSASNTGTTIVNNLVNGTYA